MKKGRGKRVKRALSEATFSQYHWKVGGMDTFLGGIWPLNDFGNAEDNI